MPFKPPIIFCLLLFSSCNNTVTPSTINTNANKRTVANKNDINPYHNIKDIPLPEGYRRIEAESNSFALWLRTTRLKENKTVYLYNGGAKTNQLAQFAVMDISIGNKNLQQCADAVMRLRAEYFFAQKKYSDISFTDNDKTAYTFNAPYTKEHFTNYLQQVFGMCGSASLSKQLKPVIDFSDITPGDVLIRGGFPGHAVIVMDVAENVKGEKIFMLAQSYMPAQDIHILVNPADENLSPWYKVNDGIKIVTPEYLFYKNELKRW